MKRAVGYFRLSNTRGDDVSLERQQRVFHDFLATRTEFAHTCARDDFCEPVGKRSGTSAAARPRFRELLAQIESADDLGLVWCYDLARFTRADDLMLLLKKMQRRRIEFTTHRDAVDLASFDGQINLRAKGFINVLYALNVSASQKARIAAEKAAGAWVGRPPLGLVSTGKGAQRKLIPRTETYQVNGQAHTYLDTVRVWFELYTGAKPIGMPQGARWLNEHGYRWRSKRGEPVPVKHFNLQKLDPRHYRGVLDAQLLRRVEKRQRERARAQRNGARLQHPPCLLWGLAYCAACGHRYSSTYGNGHSGRYPMYKHYRGECDHEGVIAAHLIDDGVIAYLTEHLVLDDESKEKVARKMSAAPLVQTENERTRLEQALDRLEDLAIDGGIPKEKYLKRRQEILTALAEVTPAATAPARPTFAEALFFVTDLGEKLRNVKGMEAFEANRFLADVLKAVYIQDRRVVRYEWQPPFQEWLEISGKDF